MAMGRPSQPEVLYKARGSTQFLVRAFIGILYSSSLLVLLANAALTGSADANNLTLLFAVLFGAGLCGHVLLLSLWSFWLGLRSVTRVHLDREQLVVKRVLGERLVNVAEVRLRKRPVLVGYKYTCYRLELADGRGIGEIVMHWPGEEQQEGIQNLREILCKYSGAEQEGASTEAEGRVALRVAQLLSGIVNRSPWLGRSLLVFWLVAGYASLPVAAARWNELGVVSVLSLAMVLVEVPFVIAALAAVKSGKGVGRGLEVALKLLQIAWGCFVVSVIWEWLGNSGYAWVAVLVACIYGSAVLVEWAAPGTVFVPFSRSQQDGRGSTEVPTEEV